MSTADNNGWVRLVAVVEADDAKLEYQIGAGAFAATWQKLLANGTDARITRWYYVAQQPDELDPHLRVATEYLVVNPRSGIVEWSDIRTWEATLAEDVPVTDDGSRQLAESAQFDAPCDDEWYWVLPDGSPDLVGATA